MRAIIFRKVGNPDQLVFDEIAAPAIQLEEVVVRVRASAVCGSDLINRRGGFPLMKLPIVLRHELAGEVVSVGTVAAASGLKAGDRGINLHRLSCGRCRRCLAGEVILCVRAWQSV